jgi:hypothetical protein
MFLVVTLPWSGSDSHSALGDIWAARPSVRAEDERAERRAAAIAEERQQQRVQHAASIRADAYLCPEDSCPKSISGQGCSSLHSLKNHLDSHGTESNIQNDIYLCHVEDCYRAQPGKGSGTSDAAKYHADTHAKKNTDSFLCSDPECGRS